MPVAFTCQTGSTHALIKCIDACSCDDGSYAKLLVANDAIGSAAPEATGVPWQRRSTHDRQTLEHWRSRERFHRRFGAALDRRTQ